MPDPRTVVDSFQQHTSNEQLMAFSLSPYARIHRVLEEEEGANKAAKTEDTIALRCASDFADLLL